MEEDDFYRILGVERRATQTDIKKAYKDKARHLHPDKGGDPEAFKKVNEAYRVLGNEETRTRYDQFGRAGLEMTGDMSAADMFPGFFDIFGGQSRGEVRRRTPDRVLNLDLTLEEAYHGAPIRYRFKRKIFTGKATRCETCKGQGRITERMATSIGILQNVRMCSACAGLGKTVRESQFQTRAEIADVVVPPHCHIGYQIIISEKADEMPDHETGNLVLSVVFKKHPVFDVVDGYHLTCVLDIHPVEAMTHFYRSLVLPSGETMIMAHREGEPFCSRLDQFRTIRGRGLYNQRRERGDVRVRFRLQDFTIPMNLRNNVLKPRHYVEEDTLESTQSGNHVISIKELPLMDIFPSPSSTSHERRSAPHPASHGFASAQPQECRQS